MDAIVGRLVVEEIRQEALKLVLGKNIKFYCYETNY